MRRTVSNPGWDAPRSERVAPNANPDFKDVIDRGRPVSLESVCRHRGRSVDTPNFWPDRPPEFRTVVQAYSADACAVAMRVLGTIASAVGRDDARFDGTFKTPVALLRGNHHPKRPDWAGEKDFGIALHTDHGYLTLLAPGTFINNFDETQGVWAERRVKATLHRVMGGQNNRVWVRRSVYPFYGTNVAPPNSVAAIGADAHLSRRFNAADVHRQGRS